jgi:hypothetical protein
VAATNALFESNGDTDVLTGGSGADWFIVGMGDRISDLAQSTRGAHDGGDQITYI